MTLQDIKELATDAFIVELVRDNNGDIVGEIWEITFKNKPTALYFHKYWDYFSSPTWWTFPENSLVEGNEHVKLLYVRAYVVK